MDEDKSRNIGVIISVLLGCLLGALGVHLWP